MGWIGAFLAAITVWVFMFMIFGVIYLYPLYASIVIVIAAITLTALAFRYKDY